MTKDVTWNVINLVRTVGQRRHFAILEEHSVPTTKREHNIFSFLAGK